MDTPAPTPARRAKQIEDAVLELDGVVAVRVWESGSQVEIGVRVGPVDGVTSVLHHVQELVDAMRAPDEEWSVGLLSE
jgi:hypothetical protein